MTKRRSGSRGAKRPKAPLSMKEQAVRWINARANRGEAKSTGKPLRSDRTVNRYREDLGRAATWVAEKFGVTQIKTITPAQAQAYLDYRRRDKLRAKTIQGYAMALKTLPTIDVLKTPSRRSDALDKPTASRAYTNQQIEQVKKCLPQQACLSIRIMQEAGCRARDLASIRLAHEKPLQRARLHQLHPGRFNSREQWVKVNFIGKGGHEHTSTIHPDTAKLLEGRRLEQPLPYFERRQENPVCDRHYELIVGHSLSTIWSKTSKQALGYSHGVHGIRHTYAQQRLAELQDSGLSWEDAKACTSQTMGHYRPEEVETYLR